MKVFISSTSKDLGEYRQAAHEVCNRLSLVPIGMELFESMGAGATNGSRFKLKEADVYVGILANRYGYIEDGFDKSVTARELGDRPRYICLCIAAVALLVSIYRGLSPNSPSNSPNSLMFPTAATFLAAVLLMRRVH